MKNRILLGYTVLICCIFSLAGLTQQINAQEKEAKAPSKKVQSTLGTAFSYQGQLKDGGSPANGNYDLRFTLYDVYTGGSPVTGTSPVTLSSVAVSKGLFTVLLDFGYNFEDVQLFLEIEVRPGASGDPYTTLTPRQIVSPVPQARYAISSGTAQSVPWSGVSGKPANLAWRHVYVPANAMNYTTASDITLTEKGLRWPNTTQLAGFGVPQPADWDKSTPFTVTLYFALQSASAPGIVQWRLCTGGSKLNLSPDYPDSGWDQMSYSITEDASALDYGNPGGHFYLMKSQSWTTKWSITYGAWYFGTTVYTSNDFADNTMWFFYFKRGCSIPNSETYTGNMYVVGAEVTYQAAQ